MYLLVLLGPIISGISAGFFGYLIGPNGIFFLVLFGMGLSLIVSWMSFIEVGLLQSVCQIKFASWLSCGELLVDWGFFFDGVTVVMLITVCTISFFVHLYSFSYMSDDPHLLRFVSFLSLFTFFMLVLVTGDNLLQMFVGWEGVGLSSYLLINFWYTRIQANKSAIKAILFNRVGDLGVIFVIVLLLFAFRTLDFFAIFGMLHFFENFVITLYLFEFNLIDFVCFWLFIGVCGKSAQIGLHGWLPDAMEGPTPVSALIHAATMVTAGVFALIRFSPFLECSKHILVLIAVVGCLTSFFAATAGLCQNDIKRVIAYSTCSQLGYMVFICGLSQYALGFFHLFNHAFFKALLFLGAGIIIHAFQDEQDMRKFGGLLNFLPLTFLFILIGSLALVGFPFLTGFYSKDVILEVAGVQWTFVGQFVFWLGIISAGFTSFYSWRLLFLTFFGKPRGFRQDYVHVHEMPTIMFMSLFFLGVGSIFFGYLFFEFFVGLGTTTWGGSLMSYNSLFIAVEFEFLDIYIKLLPLIYSAIGFFLSFSLYLLLNKKQYVLTFFFSTFIRETYVFFSKKWFFDSLINKTFTRGVAYFGYRISFEIIDLGMLKFFGAKGFELFLESFQNFSKNLETGYLYHKIFVLVFSVCFLNLLFFFNVEMNFFFFLVLISLFFYFYEKKNEGK
jgi:NADH-ubiquinone oxidoreductase chain 5